MAQFAKLFELPNNNQVLVVKDYNTEDDSYELRVTSEIDSMSTSISMGFDKEEKVEEALKNFSLEDAKNMRNQIMNLLN